MLSIIINDGGGRILEHITLAEHYAAIGAKLIIVYCASACLTFLPLKDPTKSIIKFENVCFLPDAWIGYHTTAVRPDGTESPTTMRWERGRDWIERGYNSCKSVKDW